MKSSDKVSNLVTELPKDHTDLYNLHALSPYRFLYHWLNKSIILCSKKEAPDKTTFKDAFAVASLLGSEITLRWELTMNTAK